MAEQFQMKVFKLTPHGKCDWEVSRQVLGGSEDTEQGVALHMGVSSVQPSPVFLTPHLLPKPSTFLWQTAMNGDRRSRKPPVSY